MSDASNLVISFQRSGLNWLRYCAEYFGGMRTPGRTQLVDEGPLLFDRTHDVRRRNRASGYAGLYDAEGEEIYPRVALLLRNPFACFASHYLGRVGLPFRKGLQRFDAYAANIAQFDELKRAKKAVFYFEEFVNDERGTTEFLRFFDIDPQSKPYDFSQLIEASRRWYRGHHGTFSERERPQLKRRQHAAIRAMLQEQLGPIFDQYLSRYTLD